MCRCVWLLDRQMRWEATTLMSTKMTCSHNASVFFKDESSLWPLICTWPVLKKEENTWGLSSCPLVIMLLLLDKDIDSSHPPIWRKLKNFPFSIPGREATFLDKGDGSLHSTPLSTPIPIKWRLNPFRTSNHSNRELIPSGHGMKRNWVP